MEKITGKKSWFRRWQIWLGIFIALFVIGMLIDSQEELEDTSKESVSQKKVAAEVKNVLVKKEETKPDVEKETKATEPIASVEPEKTRLTKDEIESMFTRDPEEKLYENATFITSEGQITADYIMYVGDETVPYISAIFYGGDLANIDFETELSNDEIEKLLGITFSDDIRKGITRKFSSVEINFDKRFADENIIRFPFELD